MKATLINNTNDDLMAVNAARVSFGKRKTALDESDVKLINYLAKHEHFSPFTHCFYVCEAPIKYTPFIDVLIDRGHTEGFVFEKYTKESLIVGATLYGWIEYFNILKKDGHDLKDIMLYIPEIFKSTHSLNAFNIKHTVGEQSPVLSKECYESSLKIKNKDRFTFETFHVTAPIFVARQLAKHKVGFSWNEVSRRYVDSEPEFYMPDKWRKKASNKKQGSSTEAVQEPLYNRMHSSITTHKAHERYNEYTLDLYKDMLENETCPEQARMILPQSTYTEWYWSATLENWKRMLKLRLKDDTQQETRELAEQINKQLMEKHE